MISRTIRSLGTISLVVAGVLAACGSNHADGPAPPSPATAAPAAPAAVSEGEAYAATARASLVGHTAPAATLPLLDGGRVTLAELAGKKPVYLKFWATWCKPCREQMPHLEAAYHKYGDRLAVFAVNLGLNDPVETVRAFQAEHALSVPIALDADGSFAERFQIVVTPMHVLIDRAGVVRYVGHEASPELDAALAALVDAAPAAAAAPPAPTPEAALTLALRGGATFALADHAGQPVALTFITAWCDGYLAKTRPAMSRACIANAHEVASLRRSHPDLPWLTIVHPVWTSASDLDDYIQRFGDVPAIGIDSHAAWFQHFHVRDVPTTILLDARGTELARVVGGGDALANALARLAKK